MIGLVVTGHGHFADGIHTSAQMIAGENDYVRYINFEEGMTPEQLAEKFNAAFDEFKSCDGVVVLSDLPGGSPFKTAVECKYARPEQKIEVIAGTNLPMIVTAVTMLDMEDDPRSLADELIETGRDCIDLIYDDQLGSYHLDLHHAGRAHEHHRPHPLRHLGQERAQQAQGAG